MSSATTPPPTLTKGRAPFYMAMLRAPRSFLTINNNRPTWSEDDTRDFLDGLYRDNTDAIVRAGARSARYHDQHHRPFPQIIRRISMTPFFLDCRGFWVAGFGWLGLRIGFLGWWVGSVGLLAGWRRLPQSSRGNTRPPGPGGSPGPPDGCRPFNRPTTIGCICK